MNRVVLAAVVVWAVVLVPGAVLAQSDENGIEAAPEDVVLGELVIKFQNTDYPSVRIDGQVWDETEYTGDGKQVSLHKVDRSVEHSITLVPGYENLEQSELTVKPSDWKLVKVGKLDKAWKVEKAAKFNKRAVQVKKPEPKPEETEEGEPTP